MSTLSEQDIREIIQQASLLQKFGESSSSIKLSEANAEILQLYEIADGLNISRKYVLEAYTEAAGIPVHEPVVVDNHDFSSTEIIGFAHGTIDRALLSELKSRIEYHFNTLGSITRRRSKVVWKAKPVGPSKIIATSNSPEVEFEKVEGSTRIKVKQSLKTLNKLYIPAVGAAFGGFMLLAATFFDRVGNDIAPALIFSVLILLVTASYTKFVNNRKKKRKKSLQEFTEMLQSKIERHLISTTQSVEQDSGKIHIPDEEADSEDAQSEIEVSIKEKAKG
jgi:hypothetical protein